jgi:nucleoside-diphosphate-sugar epimerase
LKAVVTGGAGFIGSNIASALLDRGHDVVIVDDLSSGFRANIDQKCMTFIHASILDPSALDDAARGADVVFHLAASVGNNRSIDDPSMDIQVNAVGTVCVLEACRRNGIPKIVYSSSAGIFGELKQLPISEDHPLEPDSPYGASKLAGEKECLAFAKIFDLEAIALRYFNVYGPRQRFDAYGNVIPTFTFQLLRGERLMIFGDGGQTRDFINVGDVVQANLRAAEATGVSGAFNLGSGTRVSINDLVRLLGKVTGIEPDFAYGPTRPGDVRDSLADFSKASSGLGFAPTVDLEDGLRAYVEWAREEVSG